MASSVEEERNVILLESKSIFDNKYEFLFDLLHETAFPNSGLGLTTLGTTKNIQTYGMNFYENFVDSLETISFSSSINIILVPTLCWLVLAAFNTNNWWMLQTNI